MSDIIMGILLSVRMFISLGFLVAFAFIMVEYKVAKKTALIIIISDFIFSTIVNILLIVYFGSEAFSKLCLLTTTIPALIVMLVLTKYSFGKSWFIFWMSANMLCFVYVIMGYSYFLFDINIVWDIILRTIIFSLILLFYIKILKKKFQLFAENVHQSWISICFIPTLITFIYFNRHTIGAPENESIGSLIFGTLFLILVCMVYYTIYKTFKVIFDSVRKEQETRNLRNQIELQKQRYEFINEKNQMDKIFRHDLRHRNILAMTYLENNELSKLKDLLESETLLISKERKNTDTENILIDAILAEYRLRANKKGVDVSITIQMPEQLNVDEVEFCVMLSNLLENAVDNAKSYVIILIKQINKQLSLNIKNDFEGELNKDAHGTYLTTKENGMQLGLISIRTVLEKNGGFLKIYDTGQVFNVFASLKN